MEFDAMGAVLKIHLLNKQLLYVCSIYRPPGKDSEHIELLRKPLEILYHWHHNQLPFIVMSGDLNYPQIDWVSVTSTDSASVNFCDIINDFHLQQFVNKPTRHGTSSSSVLDLVLSTYPGTISDISVDCEFSDHCLVSCNISSTPVYSSHPPRKIYLYNKANFNQLRADMCSFQQTFFNSQPELLSVNRNWTKLKESLTAAVDRYLPSKVTFGHRHHPPWLTKSVRKLILRRDRLAKAAKKSGTD